MSMCVYICVCARMSDYDEEKGNGREKEVK